MNSKHPVCLPTWVYLKLPVAFLPTLAQDMYVFCSKAKPSLLHWISHLLLNPGFFFYCISSSLNLPLVVLYQMFSLAYKDLISSVLKGKELFLCSHISSNHCPITPLLFIANYSKKGSSFPHLPVSPTYLFLSSPLYRNYFLLKVISDICVSKSCIKLSVLILSTSRINSHFSSFWGFPGGSEDKASACNEGDLGSIPGLGQSPGEGNGNSLQYSCLENPMDRGAWRATVHRVSKSQT